MSEGSDVDPDRATDWIRAMGRGLRHLHIHLVPRIDDTCDTYEKLEAKFDLGHVETDGRDMIFVAFRVGDIFDRYHAEFRQLLRSCAQSERLVIMGYDYRMEYNHVPELYYFGGPREGRVTKITVRQSTPISKEDITRPKTTRPGEESVEGITDVVVMVPNTVTGRPMRPHRDLLRHFDKLIVSVGYEVILDKIKYIVVLGQ